MIAACRDRDAGCALNNADSSKTRLPRSPETAASHDIIALVISEAKFIACPCLVGSRWMVAFHKRIQCQSLLPDSLVDDELRTADARSMKEAERIIDGGGRKKENTELQNT